jgi:hypothetical protein
MVSRADVINYAATDVLNTRDLCGSERLAIRECFADYDMVPTKDDIDKIYEIVEKEWSKSQDEAGVPPEKRINTEERKRISKILK